MSGEIDNMSLRTTIVSKSHDVEEGEELTSKRNMLDEETDVSSEEAEEVEENLKQKILRLDIENKRLTVSRGVIIEFNYELENENKSLKLERDSTAETIDRLKNENKSLKLERDSNAETIDRLKNENESLKLKIETMEESEKQKQRLDEEEL